MRAGPCPYSASSPREEDSTGVESAAACIGRMVEKAGHGRLGAAVKILPELFARVRKTKRRPDGGARGSAKRVRRPLDGRFPRVDGGRGGTENRGSRVDIEYDDIPDAAADYRYHPLIRPQRCVHVLSLCLSLSPCLSFYFLSHRRAATCTRDTHAPTRVPTRCPRPRGSARRCFATLLTSRRVSAHVPPHPTPPHCARELMYVPAFSVSPCSPSVERGSDRRTRRHVFLHFVCDFFFLSAVPLIVFSPPPPPPPAEGGGVYTRRALERSAVPRYRGMSRYACRGGILPAN